MERLSNCYRRAVCCVQILALLVNWDDQRRSDTSRNSTRLKIGVEHFGQEGGQQIDLDGLAIIVLNLVCGIAQKLSWPSCPGGRLAIAQMWQGLLDKRLGNGLTQ